MGELQPLSNEVTLQASALAKALRELLTGLGVSSRRYAARRHYSPGTVSRYFSGRRLPPWEFVFNLLQDVAENRGSPATPEAIALLRKLHQEAFEASGSPVHRVQLLEHRLADADREARQSAAREGWLEETLQDRERQLRDLQMQMREIQTADLSPIVQHPFVEDALDEHAGFQEERSHLEAEVRQLKAALRQAHEKYLEAERRCDYLERQLAAAEQHTEPDGLLSVSPDDAEDVVKMKHDSWLSRATDWLSRQEFLAAVTVRIEHDGQLQCNGLLLDSRTVLTTASAVSPVPEGATCQIYRGSESTEGVITERNPEPGAISKSKLTPFPNLAVLRMTTTQSLDAPSLPLDLEATLPGDELIITGWLSNAQGLDGPGIFSCVLRTQGTYGPWLRVTGDEIPPGLAGAPALHQSTGRIAGIVSSRNESKNGGLLVPISAVHGLNLLTR